MATAIHRQTIALDAAVARKARALARQRGISTSRLLARLVEEGLESELQKRSRFMQLAEQFRSASDPAEAQKLGDQLGRLVFGN
ncbi:MAG: hypothetical protein ACRD1Y_04460 [Terriglobales bacterium]